MNKMRFFFLSVTTILTLILYVLCFSCRFYMHPIISMITHGVSGGKIYFFLVYSAISFIVLSFQRENTEASKNKKDQWIKRPFLFFLFLGMASSLGSYIYYIKTYSLSIQAYHYHFKDIYNSVNFLPHIHTSKLFIFKIASLLGIEGKLIGMDDGRVFDNSIPAFFPYMTMLSILVIIFLSLIIIRKTVLGWDKRYQLGIALLCAIQFSNVIKTLSDGGPLAYDFLLSLSIIYILQGTKSPKDVIDFIKKRWRVLFWGFFCIFSFLCFLDHTLEVFKYVIKNSFNLFMVYSSIYLFTIRKTIKKAWLYSIVAFFILFYSYSFYMRYVIYIRPFHTYLEKGTRIHYFYYKDKDSPNSESLNNGTVVYDSEFLKIYSMNIEERTKPLTIYKTLNENPYRNRHIAFIPPERRQAYGIMAEILFIYFKDRETSLNVPRILHLKLKKEDMKRERFHAELAFDPLFFPPLSHVEKGRITQLDENHKFVMYYFLNRFFLYYGIKEFILTPVAFYRFN